MFINSALSYNCQFEIFLTAHISKSTIISFIKEYVILTYIVIRFRLKAPKQRVQGGFYF